MLIPMPVSSLSESNCAALRSTAPMKTRKPVLSLYLPNLDGGGAERMMVNLAAGFAERGFPTDLVLAEAKGPYLRAGRAGCAGC